ncbi:MAG: RNA polymerase sigma-70 factor [Tannerellaceae bacterium]|nr:RNA polymerase sigma-70 factor [Tannerellaceae bacterium]
MKTGKLASLLFKLTEENAEHHFRELFHLLYDPFFRTASYYLPEDEWVQEVVSDVFLILWKEKDKLHTLDNFDGYCFILIKNGSLNYLAKIKNTLPLTESEQPIIPGSISPEENYLADELLQTYLDSVENLPLRCKEIYRLVKEEGLSYKEVADQLRISPKTVDAQIQKAMSILKEKIKNYFS